MIIFLLPVYNEEKNIKRLMESISTYAHDNKWEYKVCVADDGSSDNTVEIVKNLADKLPVEIISNPENMGPGAAFDTGFRHIIKGCGDRDVIVTMEADNTSDLIILNKMLEKIALGADLVLASCYASGGAIEGTTIFRMILSKGANFIIKLISKNKSIRTFSSFYRCYRTDLIKKAYAFYKDRFIEENGFTCAVDILIKLQKFDIRIEEVPMKLRCDQREGKSNMKVVWTILSYFKLLYREITRPSASIKPS